MGAAWSGNTSTEATYSTPISGFVKEFTLVNKTGGSIIVNAYKIVGVSQISIIPFNLSLTTGQMYEGTETKAILAGESLRVTTTGSLDYDFNISATE